MGERSDETLMKAYADGSMAAFETLYQRHRGPLYRYILRQAGNTATANDLYQGCWEKIIRARGQYRSTAPFKAWMYRIARNHLIDHFRRTRPSADLAPDELATANPGPDAYTESEMRGGDLSAAINQLPPEQREVLLLKLESGLDLADIAEITGVNSETAKSRLRYAVDKLKRTLGT